MSLKRPAELSASDAVARSTEAYLEVARQFALTTARIFDRLDAMSASQAAVYLSSIGEEHALELLREINRSIRELARKVDELDRRRPTGHTDRLKLTEEQSQLLDARLRDVEQGYYQTIIHEEAKDRKMREDMHEHARRTTPLWRLAWDKISEWWSSGK